MKRLLALALLFAAASPAAAQRWVVDPTKSRIGFTATWLGKAVRGSFRRWSTAIDFDPARLAAARIAVDIDLRSAVTGDKTVDGALPEEDWFDTGAATNARFVSVNVTSTGPGRYIARGTLTLRGKTVPVALPFSLAIGGKVAIVNGAVTLDRRAFGLGLESDASAAYVAFAVPVQISVTAAR